MELSVSARIRLHEGQRLAREANERVVRRCVCCGEESHMPEFTGWFCGECGMCEDGGLCSRGDRE